MFCTHTLRAPSHFASPCCIHTLRVLPHFLSSLASLSQCRLRIDYLRSDMTRYQCCQGVLPPCMCFKPGQMGEKDCPYACLCCEVMCCPGLAMSSTRAAVMGDYNLGSDPFDRKLIRCVNCLQMTACLCRVASAFEPSCNDVADAMSCIADFAFWSVMGCMASQVNNEMKVRDHQNNGRSFSAPMRKYNPNQQNNHPNPPQQQSMSRTNNSSSNSTSNNQNGNGHRGVVATSQHRQQYQTGTVVSQQQQPQQQMMQVQCPQGAGPGTLIQVSDSYGRLMNVQVPNGIYPGQMFMIACPR